MLLDCFTQGWGWGPRTRQGQGTRGCQLGTPAAALGSKGPLIGFQLLARPHNDIPWLKPGNIANYHRRDVRCRVLGTQASPLLVIVTKASESFTEGG